MFSLTSAVGIEAVRRRSIPGWTCCCSGFRLAVILQIVDPIQVSQ